MDITLFIIVLIVLVVGVYVYCVLPSFEKKPDAEKLQDYLYAHRGLHDNNTNAPENSILAFSHAVNHGYGMELDIQLTKDGQVVVFHDDTLQRVCGVSGKIADYTYRELQAFSLFQSNAKIPLFQDVLDLVDGKTPMIVEYKTVHNNPALSEAGNALLNNYKGLYCVESFHPSMVKWYRKNRPDIIRGQLSGDMGTPNPMHKLLEYLLTNVMARPHFIAYDHLNKDNFSRRLCRERFGALSVAWTITSQEELDACKDDFDIFIFESFLPR